MEAKGKTSNGLNYSIVNSICTIEIPITKSIFWSEYQKAQKELIDIQWSEDTIYIKEFRVKKVGKLVFNV